MRGWACAVSWGRPRGGRTANPKSVEQRTVRPLAALTGLGVVKVVHAGTSGPLSLERFEREVTFAARLQHPHVVPLFSAGNAESVPYYTMPFVAGESLRSRLAREGDMPLVGTIDARIPGADCFFRKQPAQDELRPDALRIAQQVVDYGCFLFQVRLVCVPSVVSATLSSLRSFGEPSSRSKA